MRVTAQGGGRAGRSCVCPTHYAAGEVMAIRSLCEAIDEDGRDGLDELDERTEVWLCAGLARRYRICSQGHDYGEFNDETDARQFLELLLAGDSKLRRKV